VKESNTGESENVSIFSGNCLYLYQSNHI